GQMKVSEFSTMYGTAEADEGPEVPGKRLTITGRDPYSLADRSQGRRGNAHGQNHTLRTESTLGVHLLSAPPSFLHRDPHHPDLASLPDVPVRLACPTRGPNLCGLGEL